MYALVALGYTLVYGILELINFAHGDVFMLGGMMSATLMIDVFNIGSGSGAGSLWPALLAIARDRDGLLRGPQRQRRAHRVPTAYAMRRASRR